MKFFKFLGKLFAVLIGICLIVGLVLAGKGYLMYRSALEKTPLSERVSQARSAETYIPLEELPRTYRNAVVSVEDHRFYSHHGVDYLAIGRAVYKDLLAMSYAQGGSTITQQLAKNLYFTQEKKLTRKFAEVFMAWNIESNYTKDEILELYLNTIYFGSGYQGIGEASYGYYGKSPSELDDYTQMLLAGIPNAPSAFAPNQNPDLADARQKVVMEAMVRQGHLTRSEARGIVPAG